MARRQARLPFAFEEPFTRRNDWAAGSSPAANAAPSEGVRPCAFQGVTAPSVAHRPRGPCGELPKLGGTLQRSGHALSTAANAGWSRAALGQKLHVDLAYQYIDQADRRGRTTDGGMAVPTPAVNNGLYTFSAHLIGATFTYKF